jgi:hypothetical protein
MCSFGLSTHLGAVSVVAGLTSRFCEVVIGDDYAIFGTIWRVKGRFGTQGINLDVIW